jgi:hypothetical protein
MKTFVLAAAILAAATLSASAQSHSHKAPAASGGMGGAAQVLRARGHAAGANRIDRALCYSGLRSCADWNAHASVPRTHRHPHHRR